MHDARRREISDELLADALIAAEEQREDRRRVLPRHHALHRRAVVLPHSRERAPEGVSLLRHYPHALLASRERRRDARSAQHAPHIELARILVTMRHAQPAARRDHISNARGGRLLPIRHDRVDIEPARSAPPPAAHSLHRDGLHLIAHMTHALCIRPQHRRSAQLPLYARLLSCEARDIRQRQSVRREEPQAAEHEKEHGEREPCRRALPPDEEHTEEQRADAKQRAERRRRRQPLSTENAQRHEHEQEREERLLLLPRRRRAPPAEKNSQPLSHPHAAPHPAPCVLR